MLTSQHQESHNTIIIGRKNSSTRTCTHIIILTILCAPNVNEWMSSCEFILVDYVFVSLFQNKRQKKKELFQQLHWKISYGISLVWLRCKTFFYFFIKSPNSETMERRERQQMQKKNVKYYSNIYLSRALLKPYFLRIISPSSSSVPRFYRHQIAISMWALSLTHTNISMYFFLSLRSTLSRIVLEKVGIACTHQTSQ